MPLKPTFRPVLLVLFRLLNSYQNAAKVSKKQIVIFRKVTTCFNFKDMFRCCQLHRQLHNI